MPLDLKKEPVMRIRKHLKTCLTGLVATFALTISANAYEVQILDGEKSEYKLLSEGQYDEAIEYLESAIKRRSSQRTVQLINLCTAYVATEQLDKAREICNRAVAAKGDFRATALNSRGVMHALNRDYEAATSDFNLATDPSSHPIRGNNLWNKLPGKPGLMTPNSNFHEMEKVAAINYAAADRGLAAQRKKESENLKASVDVE